jgi:hypothetical protein
VALGHVIAQRQAAREHGSGGQATVVGHDRDVVAGVHGDVEGRAGRGVVRVNVGRMDFGIG